MSTAAQGARADQAEPLDGLRDAIAQMFAAERRLRSRESAPGELTHAHIRSLRALSEGPLTAGQLARSAELNPASVTAMLDHLEEAGIVERTRSTTDRRVCNVALTDSGRKLLSDKTERWRAMWADRLGAYSEAELEVAERIARDVAEMLDAITAQRQKAAAA
ncbi:MAG TPA: MarR family transcriptional regulator [Solirubrobacteraceae bacterium]|nr:MarR family transcriptional regulator [Solirubrobacteraceae bacterium]